MGKLVLQNQFGETSINESLPIAYNEAGHSFQALGPDLEVGPLVGSDTPTNPKFIAAIMGNLIGDSLTKVANYLGGVIGALSITGAKASRYPVAAVMGIIMDGVTAADGAVVALIDGDSALTKANAAFKFMMKNTTSGSGVDYGLDLTDVGVDGYPDAVILKSDIRMSHDVCNFSIAGAPVDGVSGTGAGFAGPGSLVVRRDTGKGYFNGGSKASPAWKLITSA